MIRQPPARLHWTGTLLVVAATILLAAACGGQPAAAPPTPVASPTATPVEEPARPFTPDDPLAALPDEARRATRSGDPRPAAYWAVWNRCAPDNRAAEAAANGGPAAGWFLVDDFLAAPGLQLGDYPLASCEEALALLQGGMETNGSAGDPIRQLAGQLLAAELNLNAGAESCPIIEETAVGGHIVLAAAGFDGRTPPAARPSDELAQAVPRLVELLAAYNRGELCR